MGRKHLFPICCYIFVAVLTTGCIMEDLRECPNEYAVRPVFNRNMLFADAFAAQVRSIDIKVFESATGKEVFARRDQGAPLGADGYRIYLPIPPGTYDILCWGGLAEGESFGYVSPGNAGLESCGIILATQDGISDKRLNDLYHGLSRNVIFTDNNISGSMDTQTTLVHLTKNTNRINVILHNLDGSEMSGKDFSFSIQSANAEMGFDNTLNSNRKVTYRPWDISPILSESDRRSVTTQSALSAEFSIGRLSDKGNSRLEVFRNHDGERIISIPLERNLLLYKGRFHDYMSDMEFLDRQDDYTLTFILDKNNNWDKAAMIYINDWATPPIQYEEW